MFLELVAIFVAALGAAGLALLARRLTGGRLPGWVTPVAAGATMLAVAMWSEYSWGARTAAGLPEGVEVVDRVRDSAWWRPWTYVFPQTTRLVALDTASVQTNPDAPDIRLADLYLFARWRAPARVPQLVRCAPPARADVTDAALADPTGANWRALPAGHDLVRLACKE